MATSDLSVGKQTPAIQLLAATVKASRRSGCAVVTVERAGRTHRYSVTLRRYRLLREWTLTRAARRWRLSGFDCRLWWS